MGNISSKSMRNAAAVVAVSATVALLLNRSQGGSGATCVPWTKHASKESGDAEAWRAAGLAAIAKGEVGAILLAGGQGSRLGFDSPKGEYNFGLWSGKSLFQLHAERMLRLQTLAGGSGEITLYVMTSPSTDGATKAAFERNEFYGLKASQVVFFAQSELPCVTMGEFVPRENAEDSAIYTAPFASVPDDVDADLKAKFASQRHVFAFWGELSAAEKATFAAQLRDVVDVERVEHGGEAVAVLAAVDGVGGGRQPGAAGQGGDRRHRLLRPVRHGSPQLPPLFMPPSHASHRLSSTAILVLKS